LLLHTLRYVDLPVGYRITTTLHVHRRGYVYRTYHYHVYTFTRLRLPPRYGRGCYTRSLPTQFGCYTFGYRSFTRRYLQFTCGWLRSTVTHVPRTVWFWLPLRLRFTDYTPRGCTFTVPVYGYARRITQFTAHHARLFTVIYLPFYTHVAVLVVTVTGWLRFTRITRLRLRLFVYTRALPRWMRFIPLHTFISFTVTRTTVYVTRCVCGSRLRSAHAHYCVYRYGCGYVRLLHTHTHTGCCVYVCCTTVTVGFVPGLFCPFGYILRTFCTRLRFDWLLHVLRLPLRSGFYTFTHVAFYVLRFVYIYRYTTLPTCPRLVYGSRYHLRAFTFAFVYTPVVCLLVRYTLPGYVDCCYRVALRCGYTTFAVTLYGYCVCRLRYVLPVTLHVCGLPVPVYTHTFTVFAVVWLRSRLLLHHMRLVTVTFVADFALRYTTLRVTPVTTRLVATVARLLLRYLPVCVTTPVTTVAGCLLHTTHFTHGLRVAYVCVTVALRYGTFSFTHTHVYGYVCRYGCWFTRLRLLHTFGYLHTHVHTCVYVVLPHVLAVGLVTCGWTRLRSGRYTVYAFWVYVCLCLHVCLHLLLV